MSPQNSASSFMLLTPSQGLDSHKGTMNDQTKQNRAHSQSCITGISYLRIELLYFLYILVPDTSYMSIKNQYMICNAFNGCWTNKIILLYQTNQDLAQNTLSKHLLNEFISKSPWIRNNPWIVEFLDTNKSGIKQR